MKHLRLFDARSQAITSTNTPWKIRPYDTNLTAVIHHTAVHWAALRNIQSYFQNERKFPGIPYHFVLHYTGDIFWLNSLDKITFHSSKHNARTIALAFNFNYSTHIPQRDHLRPMAALCATLLHNAVITNIVPHSSLNKTECPGKNFDFNLFLKMVESLQNSYVQNGSPKLLYTISNL